ncbi:hypothetical protein GOZ80_07845 [Agrobacterium vitis]|uniref:Uncharacterized protein n=1 Tax=Agrobacterium vitis TaxID=373 RepID=A0ABD6G5E4_AGRVI|nr:hypothetical protein [Agrobacterium vitis]MUO80577.1 hypothetical protein [Agrobacterium vitis]MUO93804.1 hypothetical protein [Agrobacterium vitis]MUP03945.1 hypothetical protein [Agrobacterium vitis]MVA91938.1 hypothetical protein [Agrobacterium vitis]MVB01493.1 hypothetical protein [Agrobacterium vitis]
MTKVAADYGVTGTALKKTCDRHHIPTPERGYWAKLEYGKRVTKEVPPPLTEPNLATVRISGSSEQHLSPSVREAKEKARGRFHKHAAAKPLLVPASEPTLSIVEPPYLAATRRMISKARPDDQGFVSARSKGAVPLKIAPASIERGIRVLSQLFALAETQGHLPKATEDGLVLVVENESIAFGLEEQPEKTLHQPTPAELKRRDERARWGYTTDPWLKYDQFPSGRLAIVIHANAYSGLRRTYSDGKTQTLESMLSDILAGFVGHAAHISERRRESDERERHYREAEAQREREEAFNDREKRRMEFVEAVHEQLTQRDKLTAVLSHLENVTSDDDVARVSSMTTWVRQRVKQIDALISPHFLDISARSSKVDFAEPEPEDDADRGSFYYSPPITLQLWSVDVAKGQATSCSPLEWIDALALPKWRAV